MGDWTGTVPTFTAGEKSRGDELATMAAIATALTGAWSTWTPTTANITVGAGGVITARYQRLGATIDYLFKFLLGAGSAVGTGPNFTLPVAQHSSLTTAFTHLGFGTLIDASNNHYPCAARLNSGTTVEVVAFDAAVAVLRQSGITSTSPFTWGTGDAIIVTGRYEAA